MAPEIPRILGHNYRRLDMGKSVPIAITQLVKSGGRVLELTIEHTEDEPDSLYLDLNEIE